MIFIPGSCYRPIFNSDLKITRYLSLVSIITIIGYIAYNESTKNHEIKQNWDDFAGRELPPGSANATSYSLPEYLDFAGETVPLSLIDVRERLDRELHINTYWHNNTIFLMKRANRWFPAMEQILSEQGIPDDFKYLTAIEGNLRNDVSPRNAVGFWQIRKATGRELGLEITSEVDERYDPLKSTSAACKYFLKAKEKFGNWTMAAASYNRGMTGMAKAISKQKVDSYYDLLLNEETSRYIFRILAIKEIFEHPDKYSFDIKAEHLYKPLDLQYFEVNETITDLVAYSKSLGINYKILKEYNPWLRKDKLTVRSGKSYRIAIPK